MDTESEIKYRKLVNSIILFRFRIIALVGILLHLSFSHLDFIIYPAQAPLFLKIRIFDSIFMLAATLLTFSSEKIKSLGPWFMSVSFAVVSGGMILMIYFSDGAKSHYYEGVNLATLALLIGNGFYVRHNIIAGLIVIGMYTLAALSNHSGWDPTSFWFANYFLSSTLFFVVLMTKFYGSQHLKAFLRNEALQQSEKKLQEQYAQAEQRGKIDDLTQVYNRRYFFEVLQSRIKRVTQAGSTFYLSIFDIDEFKAINDTYGHVFGDQVICVVAQTIVRSMRANSFVGRYGGDEFMLIIDNATPEECMARLTEINKIIAGIQFPVKGGIARVTTSMGVAQFIPGRNDDEKSLLESADRALLEIKKTHKGSILFA